MNFAETEGEVMRRYLRGDYAGALELSDDATRRFPERPATTALWRGCLLSLLGRGEEALRVMEAAVEAGHWWAPFSLNDPDLESLRSLERFERLAAVCEQRQATAVAEPQARAAVPDRRGPHPLLVVLHRRGGNADDTLEDWHADWLVVALQSSQPAGSEGFCWDDTDRAVAEVVGELSAVRAAHDVDPERIVLGGVSQGGALALRLALSGAVPASGYVVAAPAVHEPDALLALARRTVPGTIMVGDQDHFHARLLALAAGLGPSCRLRAYGGLGHFLPETFAADLTAALAG